jgi:aspartate/methionine/tyrosine aminotransferase
VQSDNLLTVYTFSKTYAMTGWRIGYVVGGRDFIRQLSLHQEPVVTSASTISQHAALVALRGPQEFVSDMVRAYRERLELATDLLTAADIAFIEPGGSFFVLADIRATGLESWDFSTRLLKETGVAVVPGAAFGAGGEGFVRLSLAVAPQAVERGTRSFAAAVGEHRGARQT